jgi:23S rRNA pseudouridine1911/1915/1917 synthase
MNEQKYEIVELVIPEDIPSERLDKYIGRDERLKISRSRFQNLCEKGLVTIAEKTVAGKYKLTGGEKVIIKLPELESQDVEPEDIPLDIVYDDDYLIAVNKPAGMVTHPAAGNRSGTLVNALMYYTTRLSSAGGSDRLGIVHRLDKNTSGIILVARNDEVHLELQRQLSSREMEKKYVALICGHMKDDKGQINLPIGRSFKNRKKMAVTNQNSRDALTEYRLLDRFKLYDYLEIDLKTGRTHQIRVHFSHLGHPVLGDPDYGGREKWHRGVVSYDKQLARKSLDLCKRQALHARQVTFKHPASDNEICLTADLPEDIATLLDFLDNQGR